MMKILSAVQFHPRFSRCQADNMDNFRLMEPLIREASKFGTQFLVFPELCLTGYSFMSKDEAYQVSEHSDGPTFQKMRGVAQKLACYVSYGYVELDPVDGSLYNSASMISPQGKLVTSYQKVNLWGNDFLWARPGRNAAPIIQTEFGNTSLVVCRDLRDKMPTNLPKMAGLKTTVSNTLFEGRSVDLVAACVNWGKGGFPSTSWMDFVADNQCTAVIANRWGTEIRTDVGHHELEFGSGGSAIIEPDWTVHTNGLKFGENCVVTGAV